MIELPAPNTITRPYRGLSVQESDVPLTEVDIVPFLLGREVYRRTDYLVLRRGDETALVAVRKASLEPLFSPVVEARLLAGPDEVVWVVSPDTDAGNASALARAALATARPGALAYVVLGRYEHVNVIWQPTPIRVRVTEVVPPDPPKLFAMAEQAKYDHARAFGCQFAQRQARHRLAAPNVDLIVLTRREQLVVDFRQSRMQHVLHHQSADGSVTGNHFNRPGIGPFNHWQFTDILNLCDHKRQRRLVLSCLSRDRQQGFNGLHIRGDQAASFVNRAGHNHRSSIKTGNPLQGLWLNGGT